MFGINAASEIFQNAIAELLTGLPGCKNISDNIIVYGCDIKEHDKNLPSVLTRLRQISTKEMHLPSVRSDLLWTFL